METIKNVWKNLSVDTKTLFGNASRLVESAALMTVAYYNYTTAYHAHLSLFEMRVRVAASVVIGLRGGYEFLRYLANKEVK